ncbi:MAG TPA: substrate-binding domain-containing protein [Candidatus Eisenbacteria bacterium]|nr:substrate-binding domain-containing protein [Candidatus Eisenbacteria bacterium]
MARLASVSRRIRAGCIRPQGAALVVALVGIGSCASPAPPRQEAPPAPIVLAGTEYAAPMLRAQILAFRERYPKADSIVLRANGSAEGMEQLVNGEVGMALLMRDLTDPEVEAAVTKDGLRSFPIAWDGVAVVVNPASPIEQLSRTELAQIYSGKSSAWSAFGWRAGGEIMAITGAPRLGLYEFGQQALLADSAYATTIYALDSEEEIARVVAERPNAIGLLSRPFVTDKVRALRVAPAKGFAYVPFDRERLLERRYPLLRSLAIATPRELRESAADFVTFVSSVDGQQILARHGYAPATVPIRIVRTVEEGE